MEPINDEIIFREEEKRGLLGKIINLLDNHEFTYRGPESDYERYKIVGSERDPMDFGRNYMMRVFKEYGFTNQELRFLFNKIVECDPKKYYQYKDKIREAYNSITKSDSLTNSELITIFLYLRHWQFRYRRENNIEDFLCGYLGQMRRQKKERKTQAIKQAVDVMYNKLPTDILRNTSTFLDNNDKMPFIRETEQKVKQATGTGGKKRKTKIKRKRRKNKTKKQKKK
jgi:hypothetical protein